MIFTTEGFLEVAIYIYIYIYITVVSFTTNCYRKMEGKGYKLYCYGTVIEKMISKEIMS